MSDDIDIFEGEDDAELPKKLRAKIKELQKERDELAEKFSAFEEKERTTSLQNALESMGYNPKIASFIPKEVTEQEQLNEWLSDFEMYLVAEDKPLLLQIRSKRKSIA